MLAFAIEFEFDAGDLSFEVGDALLQLGNRKRLQIFTDHGAAWPLGGQEIVEIHGLSSRHPFLAPILQTDRRVVELQERRCAALPARLLRALLATDGKES